MKSVGFELAQVGPLLEESARSRARMQTLLIGPSRFE
jgi:hypothetical protein